ncbi:unnamed protein product [Phytomonas sp. EM1]|nr:unnamed protein product [Phytomonas sp. EM1]|eukprot:CCW62371.1 unnamed protein product [Phytomonas sp. isolate EM1]
MHRLNTESSVVARKNHTGKIIASGKVGRVVSPRLETCPYGRQKRKDANTPPTRRTHSSSALSAPRHARFADQSENSSGSTLIPWRKSPEYSLVENLKQQIACLEAQVLCLKRQKQYPDPHCSSSLITTLKKVKATKDTKNSVNDLLPCHYEPLLVESHPLNNASERDQTELFTLQFNLRRVMTDWETLQEMFLNLKHEKEIMATEIVELRMALREVENEKHCVEKKFEALMNASEAEQRKQRLLEDHQMHIKGDTLTSATLTSGLTNAIHQRDYYKVQFERTKSSEALLHAHVGALKDIVEANRVAQATAEIQLCEALDRIEELESRDAHWRRLISELGNNFINVSAVLRSVMDSSIEIRERVEKKLLGDQELEKAIKKLHIFESELLNVIANKNESALKKSTDATSDEKSPVTDACITEVLTSPPQAAVPPPQAAVPPPPQAAVPPHRLQSHHHRLQSHQR